MAKHLHVAWFSAGVSSAVATKMVAEHLDCIVYVHIDDQHPDTLRFVADCSAWFGQEIQIMQSRYKEVEAAILAAGGRGYINGPAGASCTRLLKKRVRQEWESDHDGVEIDYYWGMDVAERDRASRIEDIMPEQQHHFPLIDNKTTKEEAHRILRANGIERPAMYGLGYHNNNCVGCVKGGMGYWNKIRGDFPEVFLRRAELERRVGASCINGVFLDELELDRGRHDGPICDECGIMCELMRI